ncbi:MAG: hypothetical protein JNK15_04295 [Planctomycetes bacterium]|nr:hypothetical protein [Planctomycetota bacterium]
MDEIPDGFVTTEVPARIAELGFRFARPADWAVANLPDDQPDFDKPASFAALAVVVAPYAAIVFSAGARPAYGDGTLSDWLAFLARDQGYDPGPIEQETFFRHPAVACWAMQQGDGVLMRMRLVLFEDGGRMVQVAVMAPEPLWSSVHDTLRTMLASFTLAAPRGGTVALAPSGQELPPTTYGRVGIKAPPAVPAPKPVDDEPVFTYADDPPATAADAEPEPAPGTAAGNDDDLPVEHADSGAPATYAAVALAADTATLLQDHELNQRLLQSGAGFAAKIVTDHGPQARSATVQAAALLAMVCVPYGWHVLDDTRRTLVHDGAGGVQIAMSRRPRDGRDAHGFLLDRWREMRADAQGVTARRVCLNGTDMLMLRDLPIDGERLAQTFLVREAPNDQFLVLRCTSKPADHERAMNTAELLLLHTQFHDEVVDGPDWWCAAVRLERNGDLAAAEQSILRAIDHHGAPMQVAHLYELRGHRLRTLGDVAGARTAYETSGAWMDRMASGATSGGEGEALSRQRDEHRARLGLAPYGSS